MGTASWPHFGSNCKALRALLLLHTNAQLLNLTPVSIAVVVVAVTVALLQ